jgi:hypothetical protein
MIKFVVQLVEDKIAVCEKTAVYGAGTFADLNSACSKVLTPAKIFLLDGNY